MRLAVKILLFLLLGLAFLLPAGCGGDSGEPDAAVEIPDPCGLVGTADVEEIVGSAVRTSESAEVENGRTCSWEVEGDSPHPVNLVVIRPCGDSAFDSGHGEMSVAVDNLGDEAFWDHVVLWVRKGDTCVYVSGAGTGAAGADDDAALEEAKALAGKALENL